MSSPYKFGYLDESKSEFPYTYANVWALQKTSGPERLVIAPSSGHIQLCLRLVKFMAEPYGLLYVLLVPRNDIHPWGRYQSPSPISREELIEFMARFGEFLERDARHHFWISSVDGSALLVYDNHNVLYAYGPLTTFQDFLLQSGFKEVDEVLFPAPHTHRYNVEFDQQAIDLMNYWPWIQFPLQDSDDV